MTTWRKLFHTDDSYGWICGDNSKISHQKPIGSGGYGEVHEMISKRTKQGFARKLLRLSERVSEEDIQNEARVVSDIRDKGGHENIIRILEYGWLKGSLKVYYIDMELADFTLADYIDHYKGTKSSKVDIEALQSLSPVFVHKESPLPERMKNLWSIGTHIARGLEFMHFYEYVHRDLKPSNALTSIPVLYCHGDNLWKLTDFGISANATSKHARPTQYARGTSSYRAPELLREDPTFTNKVDIWGLGCILHELATLRTAFPTDWAVQEYSTTNSVLQILVPVLSEFFQHHVSENIRELLHVDFDQRPCASTLSRLFTSYCRILDLSDVPTPIEVRSYPSYQEWKFLVEKYPFESQLLYQLAEAYERTGAENISTILLKEMVQNYVKTGKLTKEIVGAKEETAEATITVLQKVGAALTKKGQHDEAIAIYTAAIERDPGRLSVWKSLTDVHEAKGDHDEALRMYEAALRKEPMNLWLWHNICEAHLSRNDIDSTISFCRHQWILSQENPSPLITLSSLFSAKSDYLLSINTYMDMFLNENQNVRSALTDFEKRLISTRWKQPEDISERYKYVTFPSLTTRLQPRAISNIHSVKTLLSTSMSFVAREDTKPTVHFAAWTGNADLMKPHIVSRQQNVKDKDGLTALHLAVWNMHLEMVDLLLNSPVTLVSAENERGWTALHLAVWNNDVAMIEKLVQAGAINATSKNRGNSPMFWAAQNGHVDAIKALKEAGADLAEENVEGWTPMHVAALHGRANMIKVLKNARCDVSARTKTGSTPMHLAVKYGHLDAIKTLIDAGANVSIRDVDGLTPMDLAEREWKTRPDGTELLKVLKSYKLRRKH